MTQAEQDAFVDSLNGSIAILDRATDAALRKPENRSALAQLVKSLAKVCPPRAVQLVTVLPNGDRVEFYNRFGLEAHHMGGAAVTPPHPCGAPTRHAPGCECASIQSVTPGSSNG